jgi:hypothetical protein
MSSGRYAACAAGWRCASPSSPCPSRRCIHQCFFATEALNVSSIQHVRETPVHPCFACAPIMPGFDGFVQDMGVAATQTCSFFAQALASGSHELRLASVPQFVAMRDRVRNAWAHRLHHMLTHRLRIDRWEFQAPVDRLRFNGRFIHTEASPQPPYQQEHSQLPHTHRDRRRIMKARLLPATANGSSPHFNRRVQSTP